MVALQTSGIQALSILLCHQSQTWPLPHGATWLPELQPPYQHCSQLEEGHGKEEHLTHTESHIRNKSHRILLCVSCWAKFNHIAAPSFKGRPKNVDFSLGGLMPSLKSGILLLKKKVEQIEYS